MNERQLNLYFDRIRGIAPRAPDLDGLISVMQAHLAAVPFENLDVQLGRPVSLDPDAIFEKLVSQRRGGWCYEQNGLLCDVLTSLGYQVRRLAGDVMRGTKGNDGLGDHLALLVDVDIDGQWLVDVGFGGSQAQPIPLAQGSWAHAPYDIALAQLEPDWWRFEERFRDVPFSFDFRSDPADENLLARRCAWLQTSPDSPFVQNLVLQRRVADSHLTLRGRVFGIRRNGEEDRRLIEDAEEFSAVIRDRFDLDVPGLDALWPKVCARHEALFGKA